MKISQITKRKDNIKERCINSGDYFALKTQPEQIDSYENYEEDHTEYSKYDNYFLWYFDVDTSTLYYIRSKI